MAPRKSDFDFDVPMNDPSFSAFAKALERLSNAGRTDAYRYDQEDDTEEDTEEGTEEDSLKPIHMAAEAGDLPSLRRLLDQGVSPDERCHYSFMVGDMLNLDLDDLEDLDESMNVTPLMIAAAANFDAGVQELLARGASIESKTNEGRTALWYAAAFHARKTLKRLIAAGADVNVADLRGNTPLGLAIYCPSQPRILSDLLAAGANPNQANEERCTPLHFAAADGTVKQVKLLLDAGANPHIKDRDGWVPLWHCTSNINPSPIIDLLRPFGHYWTASDLNRSSRHNSIPLFANACSQCSSLPFILQLIREGANINTTYSMGATPLILALSTCNQPAYSALLECGANPNQPDARGMTPLIVALSENDEHAALSLLLYGSDINASDPLGQSPLDYALNGTFRLRFLATLIDRGADVNARDHQNCTPLMHAVRNTNETEIIKLLLSRGADPNVINDHGETALHFAAEDADPYFLRTLLAAGADPCLIDPDCGVSALDEAVRSNSHTCVRHLVNALPNSPAAANILRESLDIARQERNSRAAKLIENKLATLE